MTKIIYDDIEAVTSLLREKENDLELAAKIGQELLERNQRLEERVSGLEVQLNSNIELITQLRHSISKGSSRITLLCNDRQTHPAGLTHQSAKSACSRALHTLFQSTIFVHTLNSHLKEQSTIIYRVSQGKLVFLN